MQYIFKRILFSALFLTVQLGCPGSEKPEKQPSVKFNAPTPPPAPSDGNLITPSSQETEEIPEGIKDKDSEKPEEPKEEKPESDEKSVDQDLPEESEEIALDEEEIEGKEGLVENPGSALESSTEQDQIKQETFQQDAQLLTQDPLKEKLMSDLYVLKQKCVAAQQQSFGLASDLTIVEDTLTKFYAKYTPTRGNNRLLKTNVYKALDGVKVVLSNQKQRCSSVDKEIGLWRREIITLAKVQPDDPTRLSTLQTQIKSKIELMDHTISEMVEKKESLDIKMDQVYVKMNEKLRKNQ